MNSERFPAAPAASAGAGGFTSPLSSPADPSATPVLHAVIAYETPAAGLRAVRELKATLERSQPEAELELAVWSFAQLADPDWRATIVTDLTTADLLVLAARGPEPWPDADDAWLAATLATRGERVLTVVAFSGRDEPWTLTLEGNPSTHRDAPGAKPAAESGRQAA
jgi:hypothetical protein